MPDRTATEDLLPAGMIGVAGVGGTTEAARVRAALEGSPGAAEALWSEQSPRLLRASIALGIPREEAADVVQETLLAAFRALRRFRPERGSFDGWTHAILVRRCSNWRRARARRAAALRRLDGERPPRSPAIDRAMEAREVLERLVGGLSGVRRRVWALMEISGLSARETAAALGIREATARSHLRHAREAMRRSEEETR